jgi:hypothetical protein
MGKIWEMSYNYRWRRKSTARDPFQYFSTKPNLPRKDSRLNIGPKALRVKIWGGPLIGTLCAYRFTCTKDQSGTH